MQSFLWEVAWVEFMWVGYFAAKWMRQLCSILTLPWGITVVVLVQQINSLYLDINTKYEAIVLTTRISNSNFTRLSFKTNISCRTNIMLGFVATPLLQSLTVLIQIQFFCLRTMIKSWRDKIHEYPCSFCTRKFSHVWKENPVLIFLTCSFSSCGSSG